MDKREPKTILMLADDRKLLLFRDDSVRLFIKKITGATKFIGRTYNYDYDTINFKVSIDGYSEVEERLFMYCKR